MKLTNKWTRRWALMMTVLLSLNTATYIVTAQEASSQESQSSVTEKDTSDLTPEELEYLHNIYRAIQNNYIEEVDKKALLEGAIKGMVNAIGDPYSEFFNAEESQDFDDSFSDSFEGIGVQFSVQNGKVVVTAPIEGTPAFKAGIQPNDVFLKAGDVELVDKTSQDVVKLIRGPKGSDITLTIQRGETVFDVTLKRDTIPLYSVIGELDKEDATIGHVRITQFAEKTAEELRNKIDALRKQGAKKFIFDVRSNPGGLLDQALQINNMFAKSGDVLLQVEERDNKTSYAESFRFGTFKVTEPYVVLVDEGSASASEVFAASIKENTNAPIVGVTTFGKGVVQNVSNQTQIGELKLTIAKWLTPKGNWIHEKGVEPTVVVEQSPVSKALTLDTNAKVQKGERSEQVKSVSLMLNALGYEVASEDFFDDAMENALKKYQEDRQLEQNGIVTGDTAQRLMEDTREYLDNHDLQYQKAKELLK